MSQRVKSKNTEECIGHTKQDGWQHPRAIYRFWNAYYKLKSFTFNYYIFSHKYFNNTKFRYDKNKYNYEYNLVNSFQGHLLFS